jgi:flagellar protein FlaF
MYQTAYAELIEDNAQTARQREREIFDRVIDLLKAGRAAGAGSRPAVDAIIAVRQFWTLLIDDLAGDDNDLPQTLRANLISIGLSVLDAAEKIRLAQSDDFDFLIEINTYIRDGLK